MQLRRNFLRSAEAGIIGLFLIQSIRFLFGTMYAHISSADLVRRVTDDAHLVNLPGYIEPASVEREIVAIGIAVLAPLVVLFFARTLWSIPLMVALCAVGRSMALQTEESAALAAALVVGAGLSYMTLTIIQRPKHFPAMLLIGITLDQLRTNRGDFKRSGNEGCQPLAGLQLKAAGFRPAFQGNTASFEEHQRPAI